MNIKEFELFNELTNYFIREENSTNSYLLTISNNYIEYKLHSVIYTDINNIQVLYWIYLPTTTPNLYENTETINIKKSGCNIVFPEPIKEYIKNSLKSSNIIFCRSENKIILNDNEDLFSAELHEEQEYVYFPDDKFNLLSRLINLIANYFNEMYIDVKTDINKYSFKYIYDINNNNKKLIVKGFKIDNEDNTTTSILLGKPFLKINSKTFKIDEYKETIEFDVDQIIIKYMFKDSAPYFTFLLDENNQEKLLLLFKKINNAKILCLTNI